MLIIGVYYYTCLYTYVWIWQTTRDTMTEEMSSPHSNTTNEKSLSLSTSITFKNKLTVPYKQGQNKHVL